MHIAFDSPPEPVSLRRKLGAVPGGPWWGHPSVVGTAALLLYAATATPNLALAHDAAGYLVTIERGPLLDLFHPHHLLYAPTAAAWLALLNGLGWTGSAAVAVGLLNSVAGAACVALGVAVLRRVGVAAATAVAAAAAAGLSFGLWFYSACLEIYAIPLAFLLAALFVAMGPPARHQAAAVGVLHGAAMAFHQVHVLFGVVVLAVLWAGPADGRWRATVRYLAAGAIVVVAAYGAVLAAVVRPSSFADAWHWFTLYAQEGGYIAPLAAGTVAKAVVGATRAVVGGHFAFGLAPVRSLIEAAFPDKVLVDETYLVRGLPTALSIGLLALAAAIEALRVGLTAIALRQRAERTTLRRALLVWIGVYALFFLFWDPFNVEFWIPQTTALWLLLGLELRGAGPNPTPALACVALALFLVNGLGVVFPARSPANDAFAMRLDPLAGRLAPGDLLVLGREHILGPYAVLRYDARVVGVGEEALRVGPARAAAHVEAEVARARAAGRCVAIDAEALDPPAVALSSVGPAAAEVAARLRPVVARVGGASVGNGLAVYTLLPGCRP